MPTIEDIVTIASRNHVRVINGGMMFIADQVPMQKFVDDVIASHTAVKIPETTKLLEYQVELLLTHLKRIADSDSGIGSLYGTIATEGLDKFASSPYTYKNKQITVT